MTKEEDVFNPEEFINSLMKDIGMTGEEPEKEKKLRENIETQMIRIILRTVSMNIKPEVIEKIMEEQKESDDSAAFIRALIKESPGTQDAILTELDEFREETLEVYNQLKRP